MKNPSATIDHKYPQSLQPMMIDHVENEQEGQMEPSWQMKKVLHQKEEEDYQYYLPNLLLKLDLED